MKELTLRLSLLAVTGVLAGCATTYHPFGSFWAGGYSEIDGVTPDRVTVKFDGDQFTKIQRASDFALLRAAELCRQRGYSYLSIANQEAETWAIVEDFAGKAWESPDGRRLGFSDPESIVVNQPHAELDIRFYKEKPTDAAKSFAAAAIIGQIRSKYQM